MPEDFGSYLKHERELRGVPLDEISQSTKISISFLRALEESRFDDLPGEVFVKGFIRSYGQAIGSNVDELLAAYHESGSKRQDVAITAVSPPQEEQTERNFRFPIKGALGFVTALLILVGGIYWVTSEKGKNAKLSQQKAPSATPLTIDNGLPEVESDAEPITLEESNAPLSEAESLNPEPKQTNAAESLEPSVKVTPDEALAKAASQQDSIKNTVTVSEKDVIIKDLKDQPVPESTESPTDIAIGEASLNLVIQVDENSWFNLRIDDQRDQDFILPPGGTKTVQAKNSVVMTIGNRRATQLTLNGQQLDLPESPDNVIRNLTVNAEQLN